MKSVMYFATNRTPLFRDPLYDPKSKKSITAMLQEVKDILIFEEVISDEISSWDWVHHPAYIATATGDFETLGKIIGKYGYEIRQIPIAQGVI